MDEFMETMDGVLEELVEENRRTDAEAAVSGRATRGADGQKAWRMTDESTIGPLEEELQSEDEETRRKIALMTKCSERQKELIMEPFMKFSRELLERFEEMGGDQWARSVLRVMREFGLETVESLREACEKAVSGSQEGTPREKLKKEVDKLCKEKTLLQEAWMEEKNMLKEQMERLEREKNFAEECLGQLKMTRSVEKKTAEKLERSLQQCSDELEKLRQENFRRSHKEDLKPRFSQKVDCGNEHLRVKVEDWEMESRSSRSSGMREMVQCMSRMMKSSALPEPKTFDGSGEFGEFKRAFLLKYQHVTDGDDELVAILEEKFLKGAAKTLFQSLPKRYERSLKSLFEEFEKKLRKRQGDRKAEALNEFEELKKKPGMAFPEVGDETLSQMRTTKLMKAVREDDTLHKMLIMKRFEVPLAQQYEQLKDIVLQQENEKLREHGQKSGNRNKLKERRENDWDKEKRYSDAEEDNRKKEEGHSKESSTCFRCGSMGHVSRQCTSQLVQNVEAEEAEAVKSVGPKTVELVEILRQKRRIVIDSGSVVSIMSTGAWNRLKKGYPSWVKEVEILVKPRFTLLDASKTYMPVKEQIKIELVVRGKKALVVFQLVENKADIFLLGTNAFENIGVELKWKAKRALELKAERYQPPEQTKSVQWKSSNRVEKATRELKRLRRYGRTNQCFRCGGVGHVVRQCTSRPVQKVDTAKKTRKAEMVEPVESLRQRRRFKVESGSVVSAISTNGWERSKRRSSKWEKEVEVLAKPNFRGPSQSRAQVRAKAKSVHGQFIRMETEKQCMPTSLCLKSEDRKVAGVVSNPLFIKRNKGIAIGSRSGAKCTPKAAQAVVDKMVECKNRWVPREQTRWVPGVQMKTKRGKREGQRRTVNCARRNVKSNFNVEDMELSLRRTLEDRHDGVYTVKPDWNRLPNSLSASETIDSMESLADCRGMAVPEHESGTSRRRSRSPSGKESRRDLDTLLRARAGRMPRHHY
uniref:CCHC-type domain-containing protein n=1 Tax=Caenorhabditis japonica TaxID=281687 RepID=A0A8R1E3Z2_CAEJA